MQKKLKLTQLNKQAMKSAVGGQHVEYMAEDSAGGSGGRCNNCFYCVFSSDRRWRVKGRKRIR